VIGVDGFVLTLGLPPGYEEYLPPGPNSLITLRWVGRRGRYTAPGRFISAESDGRIVWHVEALGTVEVEQGRQVSRAPASGLVHLGPTEPTVGVVLRGRLMDISETGMRCQLAGGGVDPGQQVSVRLVLGEQLVAVRGTVVRMEPGAVEGSLEVAVAFAPDEAQAQVIRRYVLHRQVRDRAGGDRNHRGGERTDGDGGDDAGPPEGPPPGGNGTGGGPARSGQAGRGPSTLTNEVIRVAVRPPEDAGR
jgi:hypothetical protein